MEAILDPETRIAKLLAEAGGGDRDTAQADALRGRIAAIEARIAAIQARLGEVERDVRMRTLASRPALLEEGVPVETYRRVGLGEALGLLAAKAPVRPG